MPKFGVRLTEGKKNALLLNILKDEIVRINDKFQDVELLDPQDIAIRQSSLLFYWGMHTITKNAQSELAFESRGLKSIAKDDFCRLAEFISTYVI